MRKMTGLVGHHVVVVCMRFGMAGKERRWVKVPVRRGVYGIAK